MGWNRTAVPALSASARGRRARRGQKPNVQLNFARSEQVLYQSGYIAVLQTPERRGTVSVEVSDRHLDDRQWSALRLFPDSRIDRSTPGKADDDGYERNKKAMGETRYPAA